MIEWQISTYHREDATCTREKKYRYNDSGIITGRRMIIINASL